MCKLLRKLYKWFGERIAYKHLQKAYASYYYWKCMRKRMNWQHPKDINEKLFWLARYWQDPRIVQCADKLAVRDYVKKQGLSHILTKIYAVYSSADEIDVSKLPASFVLKTNHLGGGTYLIIHREGEPFDEIKAKQIISEGLSTTIGWETAEYQYLYIPHRAFAEELISDEKMEIQFFCFNGEPKHILVRNDLGDARSGFAISYNMQWERVHDRFEEDMTIDLPKPQVFDKLVDVARRLAAPFPQVRVDLYLVRDKIYFGEMTFSTSGNILWNYSYETRLKWGKELKLPNKLRMTWKCNNRTPNKR